MTVLSMFQGWFPTNFLRYDGGEMEYAKDGHCAFAFYGYKE
jgi:hypothetical protein